MKYKVAIVADDFSSVTDCGVQFSKKGLSTAALMNLPDKLPEAELISVDTESRPLTLNQAYNATYHIAAALKEAGCEHVYKSIDSTMRGNIGAELDAMMDAFGYKKVLLTPAFPHYGRQVIDGRHYLNGVPINESPIGKDPITPVTKADMLELMEDQSTKEYARVPLDELRKGAKACADYSEALFADGKEVLIFDCETEDDLKVISDIAYLIPDAMVCGSTGLAQYMADGWKLSNPDFEDRMQPEDGRVIIAAASASPITREQIKTLTSRCNVKPIELDIWKLKEEIESDSQVAGCEKTQNAGCGEKTNSKQDTGSDETYYDDILAAFAEGMDVALFLDSTPEGRERISAEAEEKGVSKTELPKLIVKLVGTLVKKVSDNSMNSCSDKNTDSCKAEKEGNNSKSVNYKLAGILMTGGDTALAVCKELGAYGMELETEAEPGIPMGRLLGETKVIACIKAGAFGSPEAMIAARQKMTGR